MDEEARHGFVAQAMRFAHLVVGIVQKPVNDVDQNRSSEEQQWRRRGQQGDGWRIRAKTGELRYHQCGKAVHE